MYGCPIGCRYCASGQIGKSVPLAPEDMLAQVDFAQKESGAPFFEYPVRTVIFSGIGEPSLITDSILAAANLIVAKYPEVQLCLATNCFNPLILDRLDKSGLPFRSIWITYVHHDPEQAAKIIPALKDADYSFADIVSRLKRFSLCPAKINYIFIKDFNDSDADIDNLLKILGPVKDRVKVRLTRINSTPASSQNSLEAVSADRLLSAADLVSQRGFKKHIYFTENDDGCNCGQLIYDYYSSHEEPGLKKQ